MINKAKQRLEERLPTEIGQIKREQNAIKTRQLLGGDNLVIVSSNGGSSTFTIPGGSAHIVRYTVTPTTPAIMIMESAVSLYIYGTDLPNPAFLIPVGSSISIGVLNETRYEWREDLSEHDPVTGKRVWFLTVHNDNATTSRQFLAMFKTWAPAGGA